MLNYSKYKHNALLERIVSIICAKAGTDERSFFRTHVAYYFSVVASSMRASYHEPGQTISTRPINMYAVNLAPSGFGKGLSTDVMEDFVINKFRERFLDETFPVLSHYNVTQQADYRARKYQKDPEEMRIRVEKEFQREGAYEFVFSKPTEASIVQLRKKLLLSNIGAMNLQIDEIGANLFKSKDALPSFLELYDGKLKNNLTKSVSEAVRSEAMFGTTPANMMLFGVPTALLDSGKNEAEFTEMCEMGYARRCFFGYVSDEQYDRYLELLSPQEQLDNSKQADDESALIEISDQLAKLADPLNAHVKLPMPDDTALLMYAYKNDCKKRAMELPPQDHIRRYETEHRFSKAVRLAGTFAFIESASEINVSHMESAIALAEESGQAFQRIMFRDMPHVKLAKFLGNAKHEMTKVSLREQLPFFKGGTKSSRDEMLAEAIEWGYTNNISIRRRFSSGVEFYSGEYLKSNDLSALKISFGQELAYNYTSQEVSWDQLDRLAKVDNINWCNHLLENGFDHVGHRHTDCVIPGFNIVVIDVDYGMPIQQAMQLLDGYKAFYYVTKRHTPQAHRFRIILPINYTLELDEEDFSSFMANLYEWLPFNADEATGQRSRKWLTNNGHHKYTDGKLLDALPFIPRTNMQAEYAERLVNLNDLGGIERWFILNTSNGQGNRNNNLLRYAMMLVDGGMDVIGTRDRVLALNNQLPVPISESRIDKTIMKTVSKRVKARHA